MSTPVSDTDHIFPNKPTHGPRGEWWQRLFEESEDPQVLCRADGRVTEFNSQAARCWELTRVPVQTEFFVHDVLAPVASKKLSQHFLQRHSRQTTFPGLTIRSARARTTMADVQATRLDDDLFLLTFKDTSRHWRVESHAQRLITAINSTADVFYLTDADGRLAFVNAAFQTVTGYSIEDALGRPAEFLKAPAEQGKVRSYTEAARRGQDWVGELVNVNADNTTYPVEIAISPIFDRERQFVGYAAVERDIRRKKELEEELRTERNFVRGIIDSLDCAIYTVDRDFRLTHCNEGWRKMPAQHGRLKLNGEPPIGKEILKLVADPVQRAELSLLFGEVLSTGQPQELNVTETLDKKPAQWFVKISPWRHEGEIRGLIYAVYDSTKLYVLQEQLNHAEKMKTMGELAAGVAHDFNNLLHAIRGHTGMLLGQKPDEAIRTPLEQIDKAAETAAELTRELLAFSREDGDRKTVIDFNLVIREASQMAQRGSLSKVELLTVPHENPASVKINSVRATQIILNLCVNARDAMPQGGRITITNTVLHLPADKVERFKRTDRGPMLRCSVADTGTGIPADVLPHIFDRCFTTKEPGKGTGLGLAIVSNVVTQAGGFIEVDTAPGKGTVFHLYFPLATGPVTAVPTASVAEPTSGGTGTILVVDDMDLIRTFTQSFLEAAGFEVLLAEGGSQALEILRHKEGAVDLLLTDQNMPGMSGVELIAEAATHWPKLRSVLASGFLDEEERQKIEREHSSRILNKPYKMSDAIDLITEVLAENK